MRRHLLVDLQQLINLIWFLLVFEFLLLGIDVVGHRLHLIDTVFDRRVILPR